MFSQRQLKNEKYLIFIDKNILQQILINVTKFKNKLSAEETKAKIIKRKTWKDNSF